MTHHERAEIAIVTCFVLGCIVVGVFVAVTW